MCEKQTVQSFETINAINYFFTYFVFLKLQWCFINFLIYLTVKIFNCYYININIWSKIYQFNLVDLSDDYNYAQHTDNDGKDR